MEIIAQVNTVLKKQPLDSFSLLDKDKISVVQNSKLDVTLLSSFNNHSHIRLPDGQTWYLFNNHWTGMVIKFPNGVIKPSIVQKPDRNQVINAIISYCLVSGVTNKKHIAYILSTAEGESNFKAIKEMRGKTLSSDQQRYWNTGYYGRGFIQVTWKANYAKVGNHLGLNLVSQPDMMLEYPVAISALVLGMRDGWYTTRRLSHYSNYSDMRRIVNPGEIRAYPSRAQKFVTQAVKWEHYLIANAKSLNL